MRPLTLFVTLLGFVAVASSARAETHRFRPTTFVTTSAGTQPPVLRLKSGDRVVTTTVDDTGVDADGKAVAQGPNPQTGPFFIDGAEPGDLLVVTIETLEPNRTTGMSSATMVSNAIDPGAFSSRADTRRVSWTIDREKRVVRFDLQSLGRSGGTGRFESPVFEMPLQPTLASIGVAPARAEDAPGSASPGPFGGNMSSAVIAAGTRVMLPVFQAGALLSLGHGHARQGDGGVTGTGVETSLDVEFSVEVVKKKAWPHSSVVRPSTVVGEFEQGWPRIENQDYVMTIGSAATLQQALQHATVELHHWLDDDFGLSERAVNVFIGQAIQYEIANVDTSVTVVAKVRKAYLPRAAAP